ncbi:hypothetical protein COCSUDRAFT_60704 [Coccomyxa subellipsoidea C-169]|uniref:Uncharacterized protein n=1 Tax=Coccomyxa subellipsoidea (strain C-169) TaxID=574566 RepID=I0Z4X0_COCSC|nr:hypothetical protein COCSUDRAFT_60704 [Coccomyxa subellipsoidea C-169]EIE25689.1 hypothetical protein COCSUDRAFT_60704 [Coccomyxa subellipsoidea C-169]|eukprot:XP_005650233.1 hypothetical protein COCSUDRAFT_60704 [Coccomyxa subellipsoidea C-169]
MVDPVRVFAGMLEVLFMNMGEAMAAYATASGGMFPSIEVVEFMVVDAFNTSDGT